MCVCVQFVQSEYMKRRHVLLTHANLSAISLQRDNLCTRTQHNVVHAANTSRAYFIGDKPLYPVLRGARRAGDDVTLFTHRRTHTHAHNDHDHCVRSTHNHHHRRALARKSHGQTTPKRPPTPTTLPPTPQPSFAIYKSYRSFIRARRPFRIRTNYH